MVINTINEEMSFCDYYSQWVDVYKEGAIREVTMKKYKLTQAWLRKLIPDLKLSEFDRVSYQKPVSYTHLDVYKRQGLNLSTPGLAK